MLSAFSTVGLRTQNLSCFKCKSCKRFSAFGMNYFHNTTQILYFDCRFRAENLSRFKCKSSKY